MNSPGMTAEQTIAATRHFKTPLALLKPAVAVKNAAAINAELPGVDVFYAVKCNPHPRLLEALAKQDIGFEVASTAELRLATEFVPPDRLMCLHPIKSPSLLRELHERGVRVLAADCDEELEKIATLAPGSNILVRVAVSNAGSRFPLDGKFGCSIPDAARLLAKCDRRGLVPLGTTMHVGTQCTDPETWAAAIEACHILLAKSMETSVLSLGGGFPIAYANESCRSGEVYRRINERLPAVSRCTAEPGRAIAAASGVLVASIVGLANRPDGHWAYLDVGFYQGLFESLPAAGGFRHPISVEHTNRPSRQYSLAGPTCDSLDVIARDISLPELAVGDRVLFHNTGAYSAAISSRFNGFDTPEVILAD